MQKVSKFIGTTLFLLPAIIIIALFTFKPNIALWGINPIQSLKYLKRFENSVEVSNGINPFKDFSFKTAPDETKGDLPISSHYNVVKEFFPSKESNIVIKKENCYVKNLTHLDNETIKSTMLAPVSFKVEKNSNEPQILIMHTHTTESYVPYADVPYDPAYAFRNTDLNLNMASVGKVICDTLNNYGYNTIQDTTLHDYPSYNGSYDRSQVTVEKYLQQYPSIKIVLDIHRDAVERNGTIINPVITINDIEYTQIMIISGADNGYMNMPNYMENLKFATTLQNQLGTSYPGLARPILFDYRNYNQQLTTGSLLVEIGTHGSTLKQAQNSGRALAECLALRLDNI